MSEHPTDEIAAGMLAYDLVTMLLSAMITNGHAQPDHIVDRLHVMSADLEQQGGTPGMDTARLALWLRAAQRASLLADELQALRPSGSP